MHSPHGFAMQFRHGSSPPPYLNRRDQMRMLGLVLSLGVVVFAIRVVGQPSFWARIFPEEAAVAPEDVSPEDVSPEGVPGENGLAGTGAEPRPGRGEALVVARADDGEREPTEPAEASPAGTEEQRRDAANRIPFSPVPPRAWLESIEDNSLGIKSSESAAFYGLLSMAASADPEAFRAASEERPSRSLMMHRPDYFRGRIVTIEGYLQRLTPMAVRDSLRVQYGLSTLWDGWVATADDPQRPLHVVLVDVPADVPRGLRIDRTVKVEVTGWFLKRQAFEGAEGPTRTPLILGRDLQYFPPPVVRGTSRELTPYVIGFAVIVGLSLAGVLFWYRAADKRFDDAHVRHFNTAPEGAIASLTGIETTDPADLMRELADRDRADENGFEDGPEENDPDDLGNEYEADDTGDETGDDDAGTGAGDVAANDRDPAADDPVDDGNRTGFGEHAS